MIMTVLPLWCLWALSGDFSSELKDNANVTTTNGRNMTEQKSKMACLRNSSYGFYFVMKLYSIVLVC